MTRSGLLLLATSLIASGAHAADDELAELLDTSVVTTVSQSAETMNVAPATSTSITAEDLRRFGIHTLDEAIQFLSLGMSSAGRNFDGRSPEIGARGVIITGDNSNHVLVLVNGHHINEPGRGAVEIGRKAGIPMEMVDHIEVIVGPGSVLYGSNAMLGVINVITKRASEYGGYHLSTEAGLADSLRLAAGAGQDFSLFGEPAELVLAFEYFERRGPDLFFEPQRIGPDPFTNEAPLTGPGEASGFWGGSVTEANTERIPSGLLRLTLGDFTLNLQARLARTGMLVDTRSFDHSNDYVEQQALWADLAYKKLLSPIFEITVRAYADGFGSQSVSEVFAASGCGNLPPCRVVSTRVTRWAGLELRAGFDWLKDKRLVTTVGVDGRVREVRAKRDDFDLGESTPRVSSLAVISKQDPTLGAYVQQTYNPTDWLGLNAGARVDAEARFDPVVSPRAAAVFNLWEGATLRGVYSEAFRAPGHIETEGRFETAGDIETDLKPETVRSLEASLEQRIGAHRLLVGAFKTDWSGLIRRVVLTDEERERLVGELESILTRSIQFSQLRNLSQIENYGVNAGYRGSFLEGSLDLGVNATFAQARQRSTGGVREDLPVSAKIFGNAHAAYSLGPNLPTFGLAGAYIDRRLANIAIDGQFMPTPFAPAQLELRATVSGEVPKAKGLSYRVIGSHITAERGAYVLGPAQQATPNQESAVLNPLKQYEVFWELRYDF